MIRFIIFFLILLIVNAAAVSLLGLEYGSTSYWQRHGVFLLIFLTLFPRLTLLFSSIPFGGFFWWIGFIFAPRYLVAILATINYWQTNPILVTFSWLIAVGGESTEKYYIQRRVVRQKTSPTTGPIIDVDAHDVRP
jgi:hypothetical protein